MKKISALLLLVISVWYGFHLLRPPTPLPADAPITEFSADRAQVHVERIARQPRPAGSRAHREVREYLLGELEQMGLDPAVQSGISVQRGRAAAAEVHNIIARIPGTDSRQTIMAMAHYDSAPNAAGAGDDASGVAAILESVRALLSGEPLRNDILIVITDAEERGLFGAELFMEEHEAAGEVDLVINLEARGSSGPSIMFETGSGNAALIPHFVRSAPHPVANSLTYTVYKLLPNDTDLSVTKEAGLPGLNFAIAKNYLDYHTMQDTPENLSRGSLQHHGDNLLPALRYFGNRTAELESDRDLVYFNNLSGSVSWYPAAWSFPLALAALFLFLIQFVWLWRTGRVTAGGWAGGTAVFLLIIAAGALLTLYGFRLAEALNPQYRWLMHGEVYPNTWYLAAFSALVLALSAAAFAGFVTRWQAGGLFSGIYTVWILLSLGVAWYLPTASYLFTLPVLLGAAGWLAVGGKWPAAGKNRETADTKRESETDREKTAGEGVSWLTLLILWVSLLPALYLIPSYIELIPAMLTTKNLFISMILLTLLAGLCWPLLQITIHPRPWRWAGGLALLGIFCMGGALLNSGFDERHRKQNHLLYAGDIDRNSAWWISGDHETDRWTEQFLGDAPAAGLPGTFSGLPSGELLYSEAEMIPEPRFELRNLTAANNHYRFRLFPPGGSVSLRLELPEGSHFALLTIGGKVMLDESDSRRGFQYYGNGSQPLEVTMTVSGEAEPELTVEAVVPGLPEELTRRRDPRQPHMMPVPFSTGDVTLWKKSFRLSR